MELYYGKLFYVFITSLNLFTTCHVYNNKESHLSQLDGEITEIFLNTMNSKGLQIILTKTILKFCKRMHFQAINCPFFPPLKCVTSLQFAGQI